MPPKGSAKPFLELEWQQKGRVVKPIAETIQSYCPSTAHANALLELVSQRCRSFLPEFSLQSADTSISSRLVASLGQLRNSVSEIFRKSRHHVASVSIADLDTVVCHLPVSRQKLCEWGFVIQPKSYSAALGRTPGTSTSSSSSGINLGGRPSKTNDAKLRELVDKTLRPYLKESERVLVLGRGAMRRMVLAQHLTKKKSAIYFSELELAQSMSRQTFTKILKIHFPHVKNPRRMTDICIPTFALVLCFFVLGFFYFVLAGRCTQHNKDTCRGKVL